MIDHDCGGPVPSFDASRDLRVVRNLRDQEKPGTPYAGTVFAAGTSPFAVRIPFLSAGRCVTWRLNGSAVVLGSGISPLCGSSLVQPIVSAPSTKCDSGSGTVAAEVSAVNSGAATLTWSAQCAGRSQTVTPIGVNAVRLSIPAVVGSSCEVRLVASFGASGVSVTNSRTITIQTSDVGSCASAPVDCRGQANGNSILDPTCGCIDQGDRNALTKCFSCSIVDIQGVQGRVDGLLKSLEKVALSALKRAAQIEDIEPLQFETDLRVRLRTSQVRGWTAVWTKMPSQTALCPDTKASQICTVVPAAEQGKVLANLRCHADTLYADARKAIRIYKSSIRGLSTGQTLHSRLLRGFSRKIDRLYKTEIQEIAKLPSSYVDCGRSASNVSIEPAIACIGTTSKQS